MTGTAAISRTLTADEGAWTSRINAELSPMPVSSYRWYASGKEIQGATTKTLALAPSQKGKKVHVVVTAKSSRYASASASSAAVAIA